ncbi:MAG: YraN family protein [Rickettsiales bacterium]
MNKNSKRKKAYRLGIAAEKKAAIFLWLKGYSIIETNYSCPQGEIDIIAKKGKTIIIAEVKARKNFDDCAYSITPSKRQKISKATNWFMTYGKKKSIFIKNNDYILRFDAILITPKRLPKHIKDAWRE